MRAKGPAWLVGGCLAWAALGFAIAGGALRDVDADARLPVGIASVVFPAAAVAAALAVRQVRLRSAGALLIVSVATPTYFAWALNVPALVVGLVLLVAPQVVTRRRPRGLEVSGS